MLCQIWDYLHYYLGIQFHEMEDNIVMSQSRYVLKLLDRFNMTECKSISTPMETCLKLSASKDMNKFDDVNLYCQGVGCLIYLCNTRPDIQYAVSQVSKYMHDPYISH
jgi:hypothetical protein